MKKVIGIMGSPRKEGNTAKILRNISDKAPDGIQMETVNLTEYQINCCTGCCSCQNNSNDFICSQNDDANLLLKKIIKADAVLYATPLYGHNFSGQMKVFLDRHTSLFKFVEGKNRSVKDMKIISAIKNKPVGLIVSCQGPEENNSELIQMLFDKFCESSLSICIGKYIFPFCNTNATKSYYRKENFDTIWQDILHSL